MSKAVHRSGVRDAGSMQPAANARLGLKVGDWVEVRSMEEILRTLDRSAQLQSLPFMPQMLGYCGKRYRVRKRAHKLCDTANSTGGRQMEDAVFLEDLRCDGAAYGGCEMRCLIFWKEAWLRRVDGPRANSTFERFAPAGDLEGSRMDSDCTAQVVYDSTCNREASERIGDVVFVCQATQMPSATSPLSRWSVSQYLQDYESGNASIGEILSALIYLLYSKVVWAGIGMGAPLRWAYDQFQITRGGTPFPDQFGRIPANARTPASNIGVDVGDFVRVKEHTAILETVDVNLRNRGMSFHPVMVPHCGKTFRVLQRAGKIMNERTGQLMTLKNECLVLDGADCLGRYTNPILCPRACYPYWREIWLERVEPSAAHSSSESSESGLSAPSGHQLSR